MWSCSRRSQSCWRTKCGCEYLHFSPVPKSPRPIPNQVPISSKAQLVQRGLSILHLYQNASIQDRQINCRKDQMRSPM